MWIETWWSVLVPLSRLNSFASNGECGLKQKPRHARLGRVLQFIRQQWRMWIETPNLPIQAAASQEFIRQQWRMWIETRRPLLWPGGRGNSFASNGECGLKHQHGHRGRPRGQFIRQQWRMWIETECSALQKRRD